MRILITTDVFPPGAGGSGQSTAVLARALTRQGHEVQVVAGKASLNGTRHRSWGEIPVIDVGLAGVGSDARREDRLAVFLESWSRSERVDLAHAQHRISAGATLRASRVGKYPVIVTVRDYWPVCLWSTRLSGRVRCPGCSYGRRVLCVGRHRPVLWPLTPFLPPVVGWKLGRRRRALDGAEAVVAVSEAVEKALVREDVTVIPNMLDLDAIDRALERDLPLDVPERFVLFAGKLEPNKAPDRLIPILRAGEVALPLLVAGEGRLRAVLEASARRSGRDVRFLGWLEEETTLALMRRAAAVVFPSRWEEPLSRVLLEGLGVGAVLVAKPTGGTEDMVESGESGLLGSTDEELGGALCRVLSDESLASKLRRGARRRAEECFSVAAVLPRVEALYRDVVERWRKDA